jgi:hypothetical protein
MPYTKNEIEKLDFYTDFRDGLRYEYLNQMSASAENNFREERNATTGQSNLVNKLVDRSITELSEDVIADVLPGEVENGNVVTDDDPTSQNRWLVDDNQKRKFSNIGEFYGLGYFFSDLRALTQSQLDSIPDGDEI